MGEAFLQAGTFLYEPYYIAVGAAAITGWIIIWNALAFLAMARVRHLPPIDEGLLPRGEVSSAGLPSLPAPTGVLEFVAPSPRKHFPPEKTSDFLLGAQGLCFESWNLEPFWVADSESQFLRPKRRPLECLQMTCWLTGPEPLCLSAG